MLNRTKLLLSLAVPTLTAIILAILWRRNENNPALNERQQDRQGDADSQNNSYGEELINDNEASLTRSDSQCEEEEIHEDLNSEAYATKEEPDSKDKDGQIIDEVDGSDAEVYEHEDDLLKTLDDCPHTNKVFPHSHLEGKKVSIDSGVDHHEHYKKISCTSITDSGLDHHENSKKISCSTIDSGVDHSDGKKMSCCTIDSGFEMTKQPSFDLKDYWLEETLSEGSGDSTGLSSYAEPPLERYLRGDVPEGDKMVWEIEFPQILCGRLIGRKGKNVKVISDSSGAKIRLIPQSPGEVSTHRIISISGDCSQIKCALDSIHEKFPAVPLNRINATASQVQGVITPALVPTIPVASPVPYVQTVLPNIANFNVVVTSVLDGNHFFIQLHNDTLQAQLQQLHQTMLQCYGQGTGGPLSLPLPHPIIVGAYCAAPAFTYDGWYRAQVLGPTGNGDEVQVKYLDYGGYGRIGASSLRQLRSDFLSYLPFQAVECYLSNVAPINGDGFSLVSSAVLEDLTMNSVLTARVVGHRNQLPCLELYLVQGQQTIMINRELVNRGLARWVES